MNKWDRIIALIVFVIALLLIAGAVWLRGRM